MLSLSTKYAISALLELTHVASGEYLQIQALSERAEVPGPYLSKIMKILSAKGIIESKKGLSGGVRLATTKTPLTYFDVCVALDDPVVSNKCLLSKKSCSHESPCQIHDQWKGVRSQLMQFLERALVMNIYL